MRRLLACMVAAAAVSGVAADDAVAQSRGFGLGVIIGEPTGLSAKLWQTRRTALDFGAAWSFVDDADFHLHMDFLWHRFDLIHVDEGQLPLYFGLGGRVKFHDQESDNQDTEVGISFPVGLDYLFDSVPFDLFLEVVPILDVAPDSDVTLNASLGFRYWFH